MKECCCAFGLCGESDASDASSYNERHILYCVLLKSVVYDGQFDLSINSCASVFV